MVLRGLRIVIVTYKTQFAVNWVFISVLSAETVTVMLLALNANKLAWVVTISCTGKNCPLHRAAFKKHILCSKLCTLIKANSPICLVILVPCVASRLSYISAFRPGAHGDDSPGVTKLLCCNTAICIMNEMCIM